MLTAGKSGKVPPGQISGSGNVAEPFRYFYHPDHLGSTRYVTDASGEVFQHMEYFAFGETFVEEHSNTDKTPYLFNGKELDEETGLYYYGARYYDARTSIFQSTDRFSDQYPSLSPYQYAANNLIKFIDVNGDSTIVVISGVAKGSLKTTNRQKEYAAYQLSVYENMSLEEYNTLKDCGSLLEASYTTFVGRDAHYTEEDGQEIKHSEKRYGSNNETPPGTYLLFRKGTKGDQGGGKFDLYVGDANGSRVINGPDGERKGVAIHDWDPRFSEGCFTLFTNPKKKSGVPSLVNAIPDLNDSRQPVRLIVEPRAVKAVKIDGQSLWQGTVECEY